MAFQQDTSGQGYSPDPSSCGHKGLVSRLLFQRVLYLSGLFLLFLFVLILHHSAIHECQHGYETLGSGSFIMSPLLYTGRTFWIRRQWGQRRDGAVALPADRRPALPPWGVLPSDFPFRFFSLSHEGKVVLFLALPKLHGNLCTNHQLNYYFRFQLICQISHKCLCM